MITGNIVVYDCEIENVIDGVNVTWKTFDKMGLSVACLFDYQTHDWTVYFREDIQRLAERLNFADLVVGFNTTGFDNNLIRGLGGDLYPDDKLKNFDLLSVSRRSIGWTPNEKFPVGMSLDEHLKATFGDKFMKTEHGANAPIMWQQGKKSEVVSYCLADVKREKMLFEHGLEKGWWSTATHGKRFVDFSQVHSLLGEK